MSTTRLDRILSSCLDHAEKAPTFAQRFAWTMLARSVAVTADRVEARTGDVLRFVSSMIPMVAMRFVVRDPPTATTASSVN